MRISKEGLRRGVPILMAAAALGLGACDTMDRLLEAENPGAISEDQLGGEALKKVLVNSVVGALHAFYDDPFIWRGTMITDEQVSGINWETTARLNLRVLRYDLGETNVMFGPMSRYRFLADSVTGRLRNMVADPSKDTDLALVLAHAGYSYTLMGETMCEATLAVGPDIYSPKQLAEFAIPRYEEAITVATAAGNANIANLARVGLSRAALLAGDEAKVMSAAAQVPANFVWWVEYKDAIDNNSMQGNVTGANHNLGVHPKFLNGTFGTQGLVATQTDPRIQHTPSWTLGHNALTKLYKPYQSLPYSGYNGAIQASGGKPILYERDTDIKLASGLEAWHNYYEAAGPAATTGPAGSTLDFVNSRRAFGKQTPVTLTGDALMAELREQRGKDMYLGGQRLGDLRRWKANGVGDFFPSGIHPNADWGPYGDATCWPLPLAEYIGNPNIKKTS